MPIIFIAFFAFLAFAAYQDSQETIAKANMRKEMVVACYNAGKPDCEKIWSAR